MIDHVQYALQLDSLLETYLSVFDRCRFLIVCAFSPLLTNAKERT